MRITELAARYRLPAMFDLRPYVDAGGLISYGANLVDIWRQAARFVDKILKGAKPADLPVEQPTRFELIVNLKAAKAMGLAIPSAMRLRADELIGDRGAAARTGQEGQDATKRCCTCVGARRNAAGGQRATPRTNAADRRLDQHVVHQSVVQVRSGWPARGVAGKGLGSKRQEPAGRVPLGEWRRCTGTRMRPNWQASHRT
ncbi:MAG: hypothetical protein IPP87_08660 [Ideonella sp.]|nr:hypothetical protein [Ideonella sp.]